MFFLEDFFQHPVLVKIKILVWDGQSKRIQDSFFMFSKAKPIFVRYSE